MAIANLMMPGIITDVLRYVAVPDNPDVAILVLLDENKRQVTLQLERKAGDRMAKILAAGAREGPL